MTLIVFICILVLFSPLVDAAGIKRAFHLTWDASISEDVIFYNVYQKDGLSYFFVDQVFAPKLTWTIKKGTLRGTTFAVTSNTSTIESELSDDVTL